MEGLISLGLVGDEKKPNKTQDSSNCSFGRASHFIVFSQLRNMLLKRKPASGEGETTRG
jgi:hypothetical protein